MVINVIKMLTVDEGLKLVPYKDTRGNLTVGIGFNMDNPTARGTWVRADIPESFNAVYNKITKLSTESCWKLLTECVEEATIDIMRLVPKFDTYDEYVKLALINLMFNLGFTKLSKFHTFLTLINVGQPIDAANDLARTAWATQVPNRAIRVCALLKGDDSLYNKQGV